MAERRPPGFNVDLGFYDSDEVLSIPRKIRAEAVGAWTLAGAYAANQLTDGKVSNEKLKQLGCRPAIRTALMSTKPEPLWVEAADSDGIQFTRWSKWQRTSDEIKRYRSADAERKRGERWTKRNAPSSANGEMSARTSPGRSTDVRADSRDPKTETETETETETRSGYLSSAPNAARGTRLPDGWHPPPDVVAQMGSDYPNVNFALENAKFIDYWQSKAGKDARKTDWTATWRNWIRRAAEQRQPSVVNGNHGPTPSTAFQRKTAHNAAVFNALGEEPNRPELMK